MDIFKYIPSFSNIITVILQFINQVLIVKIKLLYYVDSLLGQVTIL